MVSPQVGIMQLLSAGPKYKIQFFNKGLKLSLIMLRVFTVKT